MYGTLLLTPLAAEPAVSVPVLVALEQSRYVMLPPGTFTVLDNVQFWPPILRAKLAVPLVFGVPEMV